jgi:hypothetical protein
MSVRAGAVMWLLAGSTSHRRPSSSRTRSTRWPAAGATRSADGARNGQPSDEEGQATSRDRQVEVDAHRRLPIRALDRDEPVPGAGCTRPSGRGQKAYVAGEKRVHRGSNNRHFGRVFEHAFDPGGSLLAAVDALAQVDVDELCAAELQALIGVVGPQIDRLSGVLSAAVGALQVRTGELVSSAPPPCGSCTSAGCAVRGVPRSSAPVQGLWLPVWLPLVLPLVDCSRLGHGAGSSGQSQHSRLEF